MWASVAEHFFESNYCTYYVAIMSSADITSIFLYYLNPYLTLPDQIVIKKKKKFQRYRVFAFRNWEGANRETSSHQY